MAAESGEDALLVTVDIAARPETVFRFFSDPERVREWLGPASTLEARVGGGFSLRAPQGDVALGTVTEVVANRRVVFSWGFEGGKHGMAPGSSSVAIDLTATATGTTVTLRHTGIPGGEPRRNHLMGWRHYLGTLASAGATQQFAPIGESVVAAYFAAWAETDPTKRAALLATCWDPDGTFRDQVGIANGAEAFSEYIGNAQRVMSGASLEANGPVTRSHQHLHFPWRVIAGGRTFMTGNNVGTLGLDGRFSSVVGFADAGPR